MSLKGFIPSNMAIKAKPTNEEKVLKDFIDLLLEKQTVSSVELVLDMKPNLSKYNFLDNVNLNINNLLQEEFTTVEELIDKLYYQGKKKGYTRLDVKEYMGNHDTRALTTLKNYNFDLIKNLNHDLQSEIRQVIWRGVATDQTPKQIAKSIEKTSIQPLTVNNRKISIMERAEMISRTEPQRAMNQGIINSMTEYGVEWFNTSLGPNPCPICQEIHDNGPYNIYKDPIPPFHPRCHCVPIAADPPKAKAKDIDNPIDLTKRIPIEKKY